MPRRPQDWMRQAKRNLRAAEALAGAGIYEEACFESHQAAEKALKALLQALGMERRGHSLTLLAHTAREKGVEPPPEIGECLRQLDKHYIPARYPDAFPEGAPADYYTERDARECIKCAREVTSWVERLLLDMQGVH